MKLVLIYVLFVFTRVVCGQNQTGTDVLQLAMKELPPCALKCTIEIVGASTCQLTDIECIKSNKELLEKLTVCVKASCTVREALTAKGFLQTMIGAPLRDKTKLGTLTTLLVGGLAVLFYLLRLIARLPFSGIKWGLDDWVMTAAIILIIPLTICAYLLNILGMGTDMWRVPFDNITKILQIFYYTELLYLASIALTKISILLFYLRIFPQAGLRKAIWFTILLCVLYMISFVTATALQCLPIHIAWERWDGEHHGKCIDLNTDAWCSAALNILLDLIVMVLPMREISKLSLSRRRKFGIMLMFLGGLFVTIVSMLRLKYLIQFAHTENVTWDYLPIGYWSAVEAHVGVMVACLPATRSLLGSIRRKLFPKPAFQPSFHEDVDKENNSRVAIRKNSHSRILSSLDRSVIDKEDFVRFDNIETHRGADAEYGENNLTPTSFDRVLTHSFRTNEDILSLAHSGAPMRQPMGGTMIQSGYSVDRTRTPAMTISDQKLAYILGGRI